MYACRAVTWLWSSVAARSGCSLRRSRDVNGAVCVIVSEPSQTRRSLATGLGAVSVEPEGLAELVADKTNGYGVDVCYEAVGLPETLVQAIELTGRGGEVAVLGVASRLQTVALSPRTFWEKELHIAGAWGIETTFGRAVEWLADDAFGSIITHTFPLEQIHDALAAASGGASGKVLLTPNPDLLT